MNWTPENYYFTKLRKDELPDLIDFYLRATQEHYKLSAYSEQDYQTDYASLIGEDLVFFDQSEYYVLRSKTDNGIYASIRITYWDKETNLPIQKLFAIKTEDLLLPDIENFWHIGRFVISGRIAGNRINILKKMLFDAFYVPYSLEAGLIIAECDRKVVNTLRKLEIESYQLGDPIIYLYSETLPIYIRSEWLEVFIQKNRLSQWSDANENDIQKFINMAEGILCSKNSR
ncbi:hypothetical protein [Sphingobacterium thalpophilum]|uniref:GNAT family N-acetyltransferase n=1 Tax=Sphingobacterium thalpophilum TaxID=259 RepID=A0A4U9VJD6_9SPHI|nr:hypothetical protein [Sphingobacterium thalpophilum]VTR45639.1 Uncharacterised protein [Sphingobacterium thalpophilum]